MLKENTTLLDLTNALAKNFLTVMEDYSRFITIINCYIQGALSLNELKEFMSLNDNLIIKEFPDIQEICDRLAKRTELQTAYGEKNEENQ